MFYNKKIIYFLLFIAISISCKDDFLETTPTEAVSSKVALSSPENIELVLNGLHRMLYSQNDILPDASNSYSGEHYFIPVFDAIPGVLIHSSRGNGWQRAQLQWTSHIDPTSSLVEQLWYQRYHLISEVNAIINKVFDDKLTIDGHMSNLLGQSYAYRAWAYYRLVTTYAKGYIIGNPKSDLGVPILLKTESPYESGPRATVDAVYEQMEKDINEAIKHFKNASASKNKSHLSINAAYGIKARIALSKGDWEGARDAAIEARKGFPLLSESQWLSGFNTTDLPEVIWGSRVISTETVYYRSYFYLISPTFNGSQNRSNPKLFNKERFGQIPNTDFRKKSVLPLAPNTNSAAANGQGGSYKSDPNYSNEKDFKDAKNAIISKYGMTSRHNTHPFMHVKFLQKNPGTIDPDDIILMRSAEMYLIEAEARAMLNDVTGAQGILQEFGSKRDSAYSSSTYNNMDKLMEHIKFQRYVELYGEGFGFHDHIRWDMPIDHTDSGAHTSLYQDGFKQKKPSENKNWIWKIPQSEIDANPNINEGHQN